MKQNKIITIFGGSGFVGSYIVQELVKTGDYIRILSRYPEKALHLKTMGKIGQIWLQKFDIYNLTNLDSIIRDSHIVINLVGILHGSKKALHYTHLFFPKTLGQYAKKHNINALIHFSALGTKKAYDSAYACTKYEGEKELTKEFNNAIIIRPSVIFGAEDSFINKIAKIIYIFHIFPFFKNGKTKFQPVYVGDIAKAIYKILENHEKYSGKVFELTGNDTYSMKKIVATIKNQLNINSLDINISKILYTIIALIMELLPNPQITRDQLKLLKYNNIIERNNHLTLKSLKIEPSDFKKKIADIL